MLVLHYGVILFWNDGGMLLKRVLKSQYGGVIKCIQIIKAPVWRAGVVADI